MSWICAGAIATCRNSCGGCSAWTRCCRAPCGQTGTERLAPRAPPRRGGGATPRAQAQARSEEHTSELQSRLHLVCRLLLEKKKKRSYTSIAHTRDAYGGRRGI